MDIDVIQIIYMRVLCTRRLYCAFFLPAKSYAIKGIAIASSLNPINDVISKWICDICYSNWFALTFRGRWRAIFLCDHAQCLLPCTPYMVTFLMHLCHVYVCSQWALRFYSIHMVMRHLRKLLRAMNRRQMIQNILVLQRKWRQKNAAQNTFC